jgi:hypothetical protein
MGSRRAVTVDSETFLLSDPVRAAWRADQVDLFTAAVSDAVAGMPDVAQAVVDKLTPLTSDTAVAPLLDSATAFRQKLDGRYLVTAPAPSGDTTGATDQAALQPLITAAQASGGVGVIRLRAGTYYVTGLATAQAFAQPRIVGPGRDYCAIVGVSGSAKPTLKFKGGAGQASGGGVDDVTLRNTGGTALQFADSTNVMSHRLRFLDCAIGVNFTIEGAQAFTEFNVVSDSEFRLCTVNAVRYSTAGPESFHGSGIDGNTVINHTAATPMIQIDSGCLPYQAPLAVTVFARTTTAVIHSDAASTRAPQFFGMIRLEAFVANTKLADGNRINFDGHIQAFGSTGWTTGSLVEIEKSYYNDAGIAIRRKPYATKVAKVGSSATVITDLEYGIGHLVDIEMVAPDYQYRYLLWVTQNRYTSGGTVTVIATQPVLNAAGYGPVTSWQVTNYKLTAAGSGFPATASSPISASVRANPTGEFALFG